MKKSLIVFAIAMLLVVTGCGKSKTLTCTMEKDGQQLTVDMVFNKDDIVKSVNMKMAIPLEETLTEEEIKYMESYMGLMCAAVDYEGVTCDTSTGSKSVDVVIKMDFEKMSAETKEEMGYTGEGTSYDEMKKQAESEGYACK